MKKLSVGVMSLTSPVKPDQTIGVSPDCAWADGTAKLTTPRRPPDCAGSRMRSRMSGGIVRRGPAKFQCASPPAAIVVPVAWLPFPGFGGYVTPVPSPGGLTNENPSCSSVVSGTTFPAPSKTTRANGVQTPLGSARYSSVCWKPPTVNVDEPVLVIRMSPGTFTNRPAFVTEQVKVTGSPGVSAI